MVQSRNGPASFLVAVGILLSISCGTAKETSLVTELREETQERVSAAETAGKIVELRQKDFDKGTVRLTKPGVYRLAEDISFNPNPGKATNWLPRCVKGSEHFQPQYCDAERGGPSKPYRLGFFAAVTIESSDIVVDLAGKVLEQSKEHALQQRFFAVVELAAQPFIAPTKDKAQGPAPGGFGNFGPIQAARDSSVINGVLGLSSHHGIHGNNVTRVLIDGVTFRDYEVAAIHIAGARGLVIADCTAEGQREDVPVRGTYSGGRFLMQAVRPLLDAMTRRSVGEDARKDIKEKMDALEKAMDQAREEIMAGGQITDKELIRQFGLEVTTDGRRVVDGNSYGIVLSTAGVIVEGWKTSMDKSSKFGRLTDVVVKDVTIKKTAANVQEVPTLSVAGANGDKGNETQTDSAGSAVRIEDILADDGETYKPDALHELRFAVAWWASKKHGNDAFLVKALADKRLGTFKIDGALAAWARQGGKLSDVIRDNGFSWMCNQDTMAHRQKGVVGVSVQGAENIELQNVEVNNTVNYGAPGTKRCGAYLFEAPDLKAARLVGYTGCDVRGILTVASHNVVIKNSRVSHTRSRNGMATGVQMFNDMKHVALEDVEISETKVDNMIGVSLPNSPKFAAGLTVDDATDLESKKVNVS